MTGTKLTILAALFVCSISSLQAQQQHCGKLVTPFGSPLKGITVSVVGTNRTTVTDKNGNFCINVFSGETIEYKKEGRTLRKETAWFADDSTASHYAEFLKKQYNTDKRFKASIGVLDKNTPTWRGGVTEINDWKNELRNSFGETLIVRNIGSIYYNPNGTKAVVLPAGVVRVPNTRLSFETNFSIARANRLPHNQQSYSQGQSQNNMLTYFGPESNEIFSWGPSLGSLEYNGLATPYSSHGSIVSRGQGNGSPAKAYNPYDFFKTAMATKNILNVYASLFKGIIQFNYTNQYSNGIMPTASTNTNNFTANWKKGTMLKWDATAFYHNTVNHLPERGANMATLMYDISTTPPTFDNTNGFSTREAARNSLSYNVNNTERQYSNAADNPYRFINNRVDNLNRFETGGKLEVSKRVNDLSFSMHADYTYNNTDEQNGMHPYTPVVMQGWQSLETNHSLISMVEAKYNIRNDYSNSSFAHLIVPGDVSLRYLNDYTGNHFNIRGKDYSSTSVVDNGTGYDRRYNRSANNVALSVASSSYYNDNLWYRITANAYNSNTLSGKKLYVLPSVSVAWNFRELFYSNTLKNLRLSAAYNQSISEAPLYYPNRYFGSVTMPAQNFRQFSEFDNYSFSGNLRPERTGIWDLGAIAEFYLANVFLNISSEYYYGNVKNFVAVQNFQNNFMMQNTGNYRKQGFEAKIDLGSSYAHYSSLINNFRVWFIFNNPSLKATDVNEGLVRIAGFNDVAAVAKKGEAFGAIYGTRWMRNAAGQRIIGSDGFPLVDTVQGIIGNPTPKYIMRLGSSIGIKKFELQYTLEYKRGGQMWNGSLATTNYLGTSEASATQRNITNHIFDGVLESGSKNNIPVNFYDPAEDISKNYRVRYGSTGVAEDAVQNASWLRLQHVGLSYSLRSRKNQNQKMQASIGWWLDNVLLWTPYSGVDPQTSLFGYSAARGLDYFNMPATWSTGLSLSITLK